MAYIVQKIFSSVVVEVEIGDFNPEFTWQRVDGEVYAEIKQNSALLGLRNQLQTRELMGEAKAKKELTPIEQKALDMKPVTVLELAQQYLIGWKGVPGAEGDLEYGPEAIKALCDDPDWTRVLDESFFAAQDKVPEIVIKNVLTPDAGGRLAGPTTLN